MSQKRKGNAAVVPSSVVRHENIQDTSSGHYASLAAKVSKTALKQHIKKRLAVLKEQHNEDGRKRSELLSPLVDAISILAVSKIKEIIPEPVWSLLLKGTPKGADLFVTTISTPTSSRGREVFGQECNWNVVNATVSHPCKRHKANGPFGLNYHNTVGAAYYDHSTLTSDDYTTAYVGISANFGSCGDSGEWYEDEEDDEEEDDVMVLGRGDVHYTARLEDDPMVGWDGSRQWNRHGSNHSFRPAYKLVFQISSEHAEIATMAQALKEFSEDRAARDREHKELTRALENLDETVEAFMAQSAMEELQAAGQLDLVRGVTNTITSALNGGAPDLLALLTSSSKESEEGEDEG